HRAVRRANWPQRRLPMTSTIKERLGGQIAPELYEKGRRPGVEHTKAEDPRSVAGRPRARAPGCGSEVGTTPHGRPAHAGAADSSREFLGAFPDVKFDLLDIVIGPQGVIEVAEMTATHQGAWAGMEATGKPVRLRVIIHFPWDPASQKFAGEKVYFDRASLAS